MLHGHAMHHHGQKRKGVLGFCCVVVAKVTYTSSIGTGNAVAPDGGPVGGGPDGNGGIPPANNPPAGVAPNGRAITALGWTASDTEGKENGEVGFAAAGGAASAPVDVGIHSDCFGREASPCTGDTAGRLRLGQEGAGTLPPPVLPPKRPPVVDRGATVPKRPPPPPPTPRGEAGPNNPPGAGAGRGGVEPNGGVFVAPTSLNEKGTVAPPNKLPAVSPLGGDEPHIDER
jgi:hypothetical protein